MNYVPLNEPVEVGDVAVWGYDADCKQLMVGRLGPSMTLLQYRRSAWESGAEAFTDEELKRIDEVANTLCLTQAESENQ